MDANNKETVTEKLLKEILDYLKTILKLVNDNYNVLNNGRVGNEKTFTYDQMLKMLAQRPMWKLTDKQIYYMVERKDDIRFIQAVSGYTVEEIKKKYQRHRASNVYK